MISKNIEFVLLAAYMVITYHIIALKYKSSRAFPGFGRKSRTFLVILHIFIVMTNILLYLWWILEDFHPISILLSAFGLFLFGAGIFIILWGGYSLRKAVFIPRDKLISTGPFVIVRHPMYFGGITGAFGLAFFAGSLLAVIYSMILGLVLSHIADVEEDDLKARFGEQYAEYMKKVPKLIPYI